MLRVLKFELRVTLPQVYLPRLVSRCLPSEGQPTEEELKETTLYTWAAQKIVQVSVILPLNLLKVALIGTE